MRQASSQAVGDGAFAPAVVEAFAADWYRKLDRHVPAAELLPMLAGDALAFELPEGPLQGRDAFRRWYEGVIAIFFDEVHEIRSVRVDPLLDDAAVARVVVNWQARRWRPPAARSEWIGFDAFQRWELAAAPADVGGPMIVRYIVDDLRPMPGSPAL